MIMYYGYVGLRGMRATARTDGTHHRENVYLYGVTDHD